MCGILFTLDQGPVDPPDDDLINTIKRRGPDSFNTITRTFSLPDNTSTKQLTLNFACSVLALRGAQVVKQPLQDAKTGSLLCWNGEAWKIDHDTIDDRNDAEVVFEALLDCYEQHDESPQNADQLLAKLRNVLASVLGPFSFLFYEARYGHVLYGRDILGRRSLVTRPTQRGGRCISSTSSGMRDGSSWPEVDSQGIYEISLAELCLSNNTDLRHTEYTHMTPWSAIKKCLPDLNRECVPVGDIPGHAQHSVVSALRSVLHEAVSIRLAGVTQATKLRRGASGLAVLFSGGIDCTLLARVIHDILPADERIDLLNVAFENPRVILAAQRREPAQEAHNNSIYEKCPDRITGRASHRELCEVCPGRKWNFVAIDVPYSATEAHRQQVISLMHPHDTEMDLSIALALYFAARAEGVISRSDGQPVQYYSDARVLISGLGADELFGGYGRHAIAYGRGGEEALADELELDFRRIGTRNLGRDDRVISHWGKEVRYPFLDEDLVSWALQQPVRNKCDFAFRLGDSNTSTLDPAKGLLRELAREMGLVRVCKEKKRAIQFGARTAKMQQTRVKGTHKLGL